MARVAENLPVELRLDRLIGRMVVGPGQKRIGRLEEVRVERKGDDFVVTSYVLGRVGALERLGLGVRLVIGLRRAGGYVARWDQIDISDVKHPRLTCAVEDLVDR
jgi:hypothetical protein